MHDEYLPQEPRWKDPSWHPWAQNHQLAGGADAAVHDCSCLQTDRTRYRISLHVYRKETKEFGPLISPWYPTAAEALYAMAEELKTKVFTLWWVGV